MWKDPDSRALVITVAQKFAPAELREAGRGPLIAHSQLQTNRGALRSIKSDKRKESLQ